MGNSADPCYEEAKANMIQKHLLGRDIKDPVLIDAFLKVPREKLISPKLALKAYDDRPLDIGYGATISQPYVVAKTIDLAGVKRGDKVLEIGTGSGYQTAVLSELGARVYSVEIVKELSLAAQENLRKLGYKKIKYKIGNGFDGWPGNIKFDKILLTAAPAKIPEKLIDQLNTGGCLVGPEGTENDQWLVRITKTPLGIHRERIIQVRFVPMVSS